MPDSTSPTSTASPRSYGPAVVNEWHDDWSSLDPARQAQLKSRQGVRYPALEALTVMDPATMKEVPADGATLGEVMLRGNIVMKGYLKNKAATEEAFAGGWFHSGDLGVLHPDGYIQLKDRSKDIIISGGENISSIEVEDALYKHPAVAACAVVGKADAKWGETPVAFVELKPGAPAPTADDIIAHCRTHLAAYKLPAPRRLRRSAEDEHGQNPEVRVAGEGKGGLRDVIPAQAGIQLWSPTRVAAGFPLLGHGGSYVFWPFFLPCSTPFKKASMYCSAGVKVQGITAHAVPLPV